MKTAISKEELKSTIHETLIEHKEWFIEIFQDAIENDGLVEAMKEAEREFVSRQEVFAAFQEELEDIQVYDETKSKK